MGFLNNKGTDNFSARVITVNGKVTAAQQRCLAEAAEKFGNGILTFTTRQTVEVQGIPYENIDAFQEYLAKEGLETGGTGPLIRPVVSCKGTTCQYGLLDSFALSEEIHKRFYKGYRAYKLPHKFKIAVGGCPNNCVKPNLNDLGIIGQRIPTYDASRCKGCKKCSVAEACPNGAPKLVDGVMQIDKDICKNCGRCVGHCRFDSIVDGEYGFKIYIGGRWGKQISHGKALHKVFTSKAEALDVIEKAILLFREQGKPGERFACTIDRLGFDNVEKQLLSNELLERKEAKYQLNIIGQLGGCSIGCTQTISQTDGYRNNRNLTASNGFLGNQLDTGDQDGCKHHNSSTTKYRLGHHRHDGSDFRTETTKDQENSAHGNRKTIDNLRHGYQTYVL